MNHSSKKSLDIEKELTLLGKQEVSIPKDLSEITFNKIQKKREKGDQSIPWVLGFALAFSFILTMISILGISFSVIFTLYQWLIVFIISMVVNLSILAVVLIFKDPIIKELSPYSSAR